MPQLKTLSITALKLILAGSLITWLIQSGKIDFSQLRRFIQGPELISATLAYWISAILLGTWRWKTLLEGAEFRLTWRRALQLQVTGLFFNTVMPGAVGGDIIKISYVIRDNKGKSKTQAMMTVLLDRIVGLSGLFLIGWIFMLSSLSELLEESKLVPLVMLMGAISTAFIVFYFAALYNYRRHDPLLKFLDLPIPGITIFRKLYLALRTYRHARLAILRSILLSLLIQSLSLLLFYLITSRILASTPDFGRIASIFPIGVLTTAIPITPGGLGVGHVAFDRLFSMIGLEQGATVFNLYILSQLLLNLLGVIAYLSLRRTDHEPLTRSELDSSAVV